MSIALQRSNSNSIQRSKRMQCVSSIFESPEADVFDSYRRFPAEREKDEDGDSSSSSSYGEDSDDLQSLCKGPLDDLDSLEEVLPIKRGISKFYKGKSKSFTSLADASSASSMEDLAKPENPYTRKRKNLLAHSNFLGKNRNHHFKSNGSGILKKTVNSGRSNIPESNSSEDSNSIALSSSHHLPPLHPHSKKSPGNESSSPPPRRNSPWRSFSLSDLQCVAAASPKTTGLAIHDGDMDYKQH
ncbi:hypothetical protein Ddye_020426 [Dipteronia dyeriana]|uniref:Uncharacterized protein n=1 Tax=Dipteronia dyeriana TaxID=168575 RepID=A0AAD9U0H9_9ROSI|nr:hypothetical protein Ddye_020426 [Dipteronia dyeriana]